jgi:hypothetical protein
MNQQKIMVMNQHESRGKMQADCGLKWEEYLDSLSTTFAPLVLRKA